MRCRKGSAVMRVLLVVVLVKAAAAFAPGALKPRAALPRVLSPRATHLACIGSGSASGDGWERLRGALEPPRARPAAPVLAPAGLALALCAPPALATGGYETGSVFDPSTFQPVCGTSDSIYRGLQGLIQTVVGAASYREYSPLIAGSLLRVRLELCVVESFFNEAIAPFIRDRGLSWILPLHETVETFLAGVVFALATNFILIGSTKIVTVLVTYADFFFGFPIRLISGAAWCALEPRCACASTANIGKRLLTQLPCTAVSSGTRWPSRCGPKRSRHRRPLQHGSGHSERSAEIARRSRRTGSTHSRLQVREQRQPAARPAQ